MLTLGIFELEKDEFISQKKEKRLTIICMKFTAKRNSFFLRKLKENNVFLDEKKCRIEDSYLEDYENGLYYRVLVVDNTIQQDKIKKRR